MRQPKGFLILGEEHCVCRLKKSLYGLKQTSRQWYKRLDSFMTEQGCTANQYDNCVYFQ